MLRLSLPLFSLVVLAWVGMQPTLRAQQQESRMESILNPDAKGVSFQNKSFYGGKSFYVKSETRTREWPFLKMFQSKEFQTKEYEAKDFVTKPYAGNKPADLSTKYETGKDKKAGTKTYDTKSAKESDKEYASRQYSDANKVGDMQPKSQKALDQAKKDELSIDQVREILNKNK